MQQVHPYHSQHRLNPNFSYDVRKGYDLTNQGVRDNVQKHIRETRPAMLACSIPASFQTQGENLAHLAFTIQCINLQLSQGGVFLFAYESASTATTDWLSYLTRLPGTARVPGFVTNSIHIVMEL